MDFESVVLPPTADMHVHLRDGLMMETVTPLIRAGGVDTVFVMPNLQPPITTVEQALSYKKRLQAIEPDVTFLMSLYLHSSITPDTIREAKKAGIAGVKVYPSGVTTNSSHGVTDLSAFYHIFRAMEEVDLVLNLHGEVATSTVETAEADFLPTLLNLHSTFPNLRIVLEHCTTAAALTAVRSCDPAKVAATITAHHMYLTAEDWRPDGKGDAFCFCKPVAKTSEDRDALIRAAISEDRQFFFGSDSAPHPLSSKEGKTPAAGVFTQPYVTQLVLSTVQDAIKRGLLNQSEVTHEQLVAFLSDNGRRFYGLSPVSAGKTITLDRKNSTTVPEIVSSENGSLQVRNSKAGSSVHTLTWG